MMVVFSFKEINNTLIKENLPTHATFVVQELL